MNIKIRNYQEVKKFQEGGEMAPAAPVEQPAPEELGGGDPIQLILLAAALAVQTLDALLALLVCQALVQAAGGGAPQEAPAEEPVYRKGGLLKYWKKK